MDESEESGGSDSTCESSTPEPGSAMGDSDTNLSLEDANVNEKIPANPEERAKRYQKELVYNHYLPYSSELDLESDNWFQQIKTNLARAVLLREFRPGIVTWMSRLTGYINLYGYKFSKQDHINLINMTWELLITPNMEPRLLEVFARILVCLLKKRSLLTPSDITIHWKPLYDLYEDLQSHHAIMNMKIFPPDFENTLKLLIKLSRYYFPPSATEEILREFRPYYCPHDRIMSKALAYAALFLPTTFVELDPKEEGRWRKLESPKSNLWFDELMAFWEACYNTPIWEGSLMSLIARLADDNIGRMDWTKLTPTLFQRFMNSFGLPVYYKRQGVHLRATSLTNSAMAKWIVATITDGPTTLDSLDTMMSAINSYYHPTSEGRYTDKLVEFLVKLVNQFMQRLNKERFKSTKKKSWIPPTPEDCRLTDDQVVLFCNLVKPAVMSMASSKRNIEVARSVLQILSSIRPDMFIPPLISKLDTALATVTEPHKLTAAIKCICSVARSLVRPGELFPEGPSHIIGILFSTLPGIDCNDIKKAMVVFQLISIIARLVPLSDLSKFVLLKPNLSVHEKKICTDTASFKDFVIQFMDKCFALVENSSMEHFRQEQSSSDAQMSSEESSINTGIVACFDSVLHQADEATQDAAIDKLQKYLKGRILEPKVAGKIASGMARTCAKVAPHKVLPIFLPSVCRLLENCFTEVDVATEDQLGDEIMFNMILLSDLLCLPGNHLVEYVPQVEKLLHSTIRIKNKEGHALGLTILRHTLHSLSHPCLAERSKIVATPAPFPLNDWGQHADVNNLDIRWFNPTRAEFDQAEKLVNIFLGIQIDRLEKFMAGTEDLDREELHRCLKTISSVVIGASCFLKGWEEDPIYHNSTVVEHIPMMHTVMPRGAQFDLKFKGENTRRFLVGFLKRLTEKVLQDREDDTRSLNSITIILKLVMFQKGVSDESLEKHTKNFYVSKSKLEVRLIGGKRHIRAILLDRILIQHEKRLVENCHVSFTATHQIIYDLLERLATSHYSKVRSQAQVVLAKSLKNFPYTYHAILPPLLPKLAQSPDVSHEQFKGALYIILQNQLLVKHNWDLQCQLWPAIILAQHSEKPSIVHLVKSVTTYIHSVDSWTITWPTLAGAAVDMAARLLEGIKVQEGAVETMLHPSDTEIEKSLEELKSKGGQNVKDYRRLCELLCDQAQSAELHWRHYNTSLTMLCAMLRYDQDFPIRATTIFTNNLIHDNIMVRKASLHVVDCVLKQNKRKHPKISVRLKVKTNEKNCDSIEYVPVPNTNVTDTDHRDIIIPNTDSAVVGDSAPFVVNPGERPDNAFLQYKIENVPQNEEEYDQPRFVHQTYFGYYVWPPEKLMYAPSDQQPKLDRSLEEMTEAEQVIYKFFSSEDRIETLVGYLSLENKKGHDQFDAERFGMFKGMFRNFGDSLVTMFKGHIERLVADHQESHQRAAAELLAAIIRGSKHWPYSKVKPLWEWVVPAIRTALTKVSPETQRDWGTCFATSSDSRDPNRLHWLMEVAMEEPIRSQGSFIDASRLYMLQGVVAQQRWRVGELLHRMLVFLRPFLNHPYHNVRSRLGAVLTNIFALDIEFPGCGNANRSSPIETDFLQSIFTELETLNDSLVDGSGRSSPVDSLAKTDEKMATNGNGVSPPKSTNGSNGVEAAAEKVNGVMSVEAPDKDSALRLLQTVSKWVASSLTSSAGPIKEHLFKLLPYLLQFEMYDKDPQLARDCLTALTCLSRTLLPLHLLSPFVSCIKNTATANSWKTRASSLDFLQTAIFNNFMLFCSNDQDEMLNNLKEEVIDIIRNSLMDPQLEVRVKAAQVFGGLLHCQFISTEKFQSLIEQFKKQVNKSKESPEKNARKEVLTRHSGILALCSFATAFPHDVPDFVPDLLVYLGGHLHDKQPIPATVKKSLQSFKRTHQDNWIEHKLKFTDDQLAELTNLLVSPSYYA